MSKKEIRIMFVCHGNICRSPMAEFIMKDIVNKHYSKNDYIISSSATSFEEIGNDIYYETKHILDLHNISYTKRSARRITKEDYDKNDYIIIMDEENEYNLKRIVNDTKKVKRLLSFCNISRDVLDPWYTRRFEDCYQDILQGCLALYDYLEKKEI